MFFDQNQKLNSKNTHNDDKIYIDPFKYLKYEVLVYVCMSMCMFILMNLSIE